MFRILLALIILPLVSTFAAPIDQIPFKTMDGKDSSLKDYTSKVILVVNVASQCGNTPQYAGLEKLYRQYGSEGFVILGFPCNDFGAQEPGTNEEIKSFCTSKYEVSFPIFDKIHVKGAEQAPLYAALTGSGAKFPGDVKWNFGKFLIGRNGEVIARFEPGIKPDNTAIITAIEDALKAPPTAH